jgi:transposase, IS6 family
MRGLKQFHSAARIAAGHAFVQNLRRGHYELATEVPPPLRLATAFAELTQAPDACPVRLDATDPPGDGS